MSNLYFVDMYEPHYEYGEEFIENVARFRSESPDAAEETRAELAAIDPRHIYKVNYAEME